GSRLAQIAMAPAATVLVHKLVHVPVLTNVIHVLLAVPGRCISIDGTTLTWHAVRAGTAAPGSRLAQIAMSPAATVLVHNLVHVPDLTNVFHVLLAVPGRCISIDGTTLTWHAVRAGTAAPGS